MNKLHKFRCLGLYCLLIWLFIYLSLQSCNAFEENLEELLIDLNRERPEYKDPFDMLSSPEETINIYDADPTSSDELCKYENLKLNNCLEKLNSCSSKSSKLEQNMKVDEKLVKTLQKKMLKEVPIDFEAFYSRLLLRFWNLLEMESADNFLHGDSEAIIHHLEVKLTAANVAAFKSFLNEQKRHIEVDEFFQYNLQRDRSNEVKDYLNNIFDKIFQIPDNFRSSETWLNALWILVILVGFWAFYLFIRDIQRNLRWQMVLFVIGVLFFAISCLYHWRHMIKVREAKRHSYLMKHGTNEAKNHCSEQESYWSMIVRRTFGGQSECERYYENVMITPDEEISPLMVITETLSSSIFLPMNHFGKHTGNFFSNFYQEIPVFFLIPATILFIILFIIFVFAFFGYGIYFPFWLGGIHPHDRKNDNSDTLRLIEEREEKVRAENKLLIEEAKQTLNQISQAAALTQLQHSSSSGNFHTIMDRSASIIESKLENLIERKLSACLKFQEYGSQQPQKHSLVCQEDSNNIKYRGYNRTSKSDSKDKVDSSQRSQSSLVINRKSPNQSFLRRLKEEIQTGVNPESDSATKINDVGADLTLEDEPEISDSISHQFLTQVKNIFSDSLSLQEPEKCEFLEDLGMVAS